MLVVNLRNISANNVIARDEVATFIIRSMAYLRAGKLQLSKIVYPYFLHSTESRNTVTFAP